MRTHESPSDGPDPAGTDILPPPDVVARAEERAAARARRDWSRADALKAEIEAAGWKIADIGRRFALEPSSPPDVVVDGVTRYGSARNVPSAVGAPPSAVATIVLVAEDDPAGLDAVLAGLRAHAPSGTHVVVVANDPGPAQETRLPTSAEGALAIEVLRTSTRLGAAAARNVGLRRARGAVVVLADLSLAPVGDAVTPLVRALEDPRVAVAGATGSAVPELPRLVASDTEEPDVIDGGWLAFRRGDCARPGPLDERFATEAFLSAWWSLTLRAGDGEAPPRRAVRVEVPVARRPERDRAVTPDPGRERLARRDGYRLLDAFRDRRDLLAADRADAAGATTRR